MRCRHILLPLVTTLSLALLQGCAVAPTTGLSPGHTRVPPMGQVWAAHRGTDAADPVALSRWWQQFHSDELDALIAQALARNTDLRMAQATLRQARAARAAAESAARPQLGLGGSASRSQADGAGSATAYRLAFSASWEADLNGAQSAAQAAAAADEFGAAADVATVRMSLVAEMGLAYVQWRGAQARERITRESLASLQDTLALARWRAQAGLAGELDVQQALLNTEQTRASLPALATEIAQDTHLLALLTGQTPSTLSLTPASQVPTADAALHDLAVGLPADLLRRRPDLRSAEAAVQAAWLRRDQTRREGWPGLSLTGSLGLQALTLVGLGQPGAGLATLAASTNWALLDGGQRDALVEQKDAALERSQLAYDAAVLGAVRDVEDALVALRGSRERAAALQTAAEAASASLLLTRHRHASGLVDFATLLEAQRAELATQLALQTTRTDQSLNLIRVYKALGGGWSAQTDPALAER